LCCHSTKNTNNFHRRESFCRNSSSLVVFVILWKLSRPYCRDAWSWLLVAVLPNAKSPLISFSMHTSVLS
jgi:hypothetical protein